MKRSADETVDLVKMLATNYYEPLTRRWTNEPFINHPLRVEQTINVYGGDVHMRCAAILHDVLEDTDVSKYTIIDDLLKVMDQKDVDAIILLVEELTDVYDKNSYPDLDRSDRRKLENERISKISPKAMAIKCADILDNVPSVVLNDTAFARVYLPEKIDTIMVMGDLGVIWNILRLKTYHTVTSFLQGMDKKKMSKDVFEKHRETWTSEWQDKWRLLDIDFEMYMLMKGMSKEEFFELNNPHLSDFSNDMKGI